MGAGWVALAPLKLRQLLPWHIKVPPSFFTEATTTTTTTRTKSTQATAAEIVSLNRI